MKCMERAKKIWSIRRWQNKRNRKSDKTIWLLSKKREITRKPRKANRCVRKKWKCRYKCRFRSCKRWRITCRKWRKNLWMQERLTIKKWSRSIGLCRSRIWHWMKGLRKGRRNSERNLLISRIRSLFRFKRPSLLPKRTFLRWRKKYIKLMKDLPVWLWIKLKELPKDVTKIREESKSKSNKLLFIKKISSTN